MLFADNRKLDPDVATLGPPKQAFLEKFKFEYEMRFLINRHRFYLVDEGKGGSICATALNNNYGPVERHFCGSPHLTL